MQDIHATLLEIIANTASVNTTAIKPDTTLRSLGVASLDAIEMLFQIEERFDIELGERDIDLQTATAAMLVKAVQQALDRNLAPALAPQPG